MQSKIAGFIPPFAPQDPNINKDAFNSYLGGVEGSNDAVADAESVLDPMVEERAAAAEALRDKALRVKDHVGANANWKKFAAVIATAADAVRGYRPARSTPPAAPGAAAAPAKKARQGGRSQQGFADLEKLFGKLIAQVKKVTGYAAQANSGLTVAELEAQDAAFAALNDNIATAEATLEEKQRERVDYYDGEGGLKEKMKAIKKAVRAQYGSTSDEYAAVKGIAV
jgi:Spy/CpxP family protein refolding chaperone